METWRQELYHHGIKGMKWGVRRFQNSDGTLTDMGKRRYQTAVNRKISRNVERRINDTVEPFEKKYGPLHDTNRDAYYEKWNEHEGRIWEDESRLTGKRLNQALDNFRTPAKKHERIRPSGSSASRCCIQCTNH